MASATLTEQMGAMALIDDLRHQQMVVQEHLNLPERRLEVARRIRDYYTAKGIAVDEALVAKGVREYFDRRLSFESPPLGPVSAFFARIYITRGRWWKPAAITAAITIAAGVLTSEGLSAYDASQTSDVQAQVHKAELLAGDLRGVIAGLRVKLDSLKQQLAKSPLPSASRMLNEVADNLAKATSQVAQVLPAAVTAQSRDADRLAAQGAVAEFGQARDLLASTSTMLRSVDSLIAAKKQFDGIVQDASFGSAKSHYPTLQTAQASAQEALATADSNGTQKAVQAVSDLASMLGNVATVEGFATQVRDLVSQSAKWLKSSDQAQIAALASTATAAIQRLDARSAESAVKDLTDTLAFARTPLTLNVVDRVGVRSGVERTYHGSGGKAWFLIIEALDPAGNAVPVPVVSAETGDHKKALVFGVRVSQDEYNRIKADKKADGHVDDRLMGQKPANTLTLEFNARTSPKPDMIVEW